MKIADALPQIFKRTYPVLEPGTRLVLAFSLLRFHQIDALPIGFKRAQKKKFAVFGFSCLSKLLESAPEDYGKFLELSSESVALELSTISADKDIEDLLEVIKKTRFGFAWVEGKFEAGGFASLRDLLGLYETGILDTDSKVGDVASQIVSLHENASLKNAIEKMFAHKFRRIFVGDKVISDRRIIGYIFSPSRLNQVMRKPETLLESRLRDIEGSSPIKVGQKSGVRMASKTMREEVEECLICEKGVVTPWDAIMKPWIAGKLKIAS